MLEYVKYMKKLASNVLKHITISIMKPQCNIINRINLV